MRGRPLQSEKPPSGRDRRAAERRRRRLRKSQDPLKRINRVKAKTRWRRYLKPTVENARCRVLHELDAACGALDGETWNRPRDSGNGGLPAREGTNGQPDGPGPGGGTSRAASGDAQRAATECAVGNRRG